MRLVHRKDLQYDESERTMMVKCPYCHQYTLLGDVVEERVLTPDRFDKDWYPVRQVKIQKRRPCTCEHCQKDFLFDDGENKYNVLVEERIVRTFEIAYLLATFSSDTFHFSMYRTVEPDKVPKYYFMSEEAPRGPFYITKKEAMEFLKDYRAAMHYVNFAQLNEGKM